MKYIILALLALSISILAGCSFIGAVKDNPQTAKITVQYGAIKIIRNSDSITPESVVEIAKKSVNFIDNTETVTMDLLKSAFIDYIDKRNLSYEDRQIIKLVALPIFYDIEAAISNGILSPEEKVSIKVFIKWVEEAAKFLVKDKVQDKPAD